MAAASSPSAAAAADAIKQLEALEERACSLLTSASAVVTTLSQAHAVPGAEAKAKAHIDEFGAQLQSIVLPLRAEIKRVAAGKKELVENMQRRSGNRTQRGSGARITIGRGGSLLAGTANSPGASQMGSRASPSPGFDIDPYAPTQDDPLLNGMLAEAGMEDLEGERDGEGSSSPRAFSTAAPASAAAPALRRSDSVMSTASIVMPAVAAAYGRLHRPTAAAGSALNFAGVGGSGGVRAVGGALTGMPSLSAQERGAGYHPNGGFGTRVGINTGTRRTPSPAVISGRDVVGAGHLAPAYPQQRALPSHNPLLPPPMRPRAIPPHDGIAGGSLYSCLFREVGVIGRGAFCDVYRAVSRSDGCTYAIKKQREHRSSGGGASASPSNRDALTQRWREVHALSSLAGCPYIVRYLSSWREAEGDLCIQTELCWGSLEDAIQGKRPAGFTSCTGGFASTKAAGAAATSSAAEGLSTRPSDMWAEAQARGQTVGNRVTILLPSPLDEALGVEAGAGVDSASAAGMEGNVPSVSIAAAEAGDALGSPGLGGSRAPPPLSAKAKTRSRALLLSAPVLETASQAPGLGGGGGGLLRFDEGGTQAPPPPLAGAATAHGSTAAGLVYALTSEDRPLPFSRTLFNGNSQCSADGSQVAPLPLRLDAVTQDAAPSSQPAAFKVEQQQLMGIAAALLSPVVEAVPGLLSPGGAARLAGSKRPREASVDARAGEDADDGVPARQPLQLLASQLDAAHPPPLNAFELDALLPPKAVELGDAEAAGTDTAASPERSTAPSPASDAKPEAKAAPKAAGKATAGTAGGAGQRTLKQASISVMFRGAHGGAGGNVAAAPAPAPVAPPPKKKAKKEAVTTTAAEAAAPAAGSSGAATSSRAGAGPAPKPGATPAKPAVAAAGTVAAMWQPAPTASARGAASSSGGGAAGSSALARTITFAGVSQASSSSSPPHPPAPGVTFSQVGDHIIPPGPYDTYAHSSYLDPEYGAEDGGYAPGPSSSGGGSGFDPTPFTGGYGGGFDDTQATVMSVAPTAHRLAQTLDPLAAQAVLKRYALSDTDVLVVLHDVAAGLAYMHERGLAHLDVKPSNILVAYGAGPGMCDYQGDVTPEAAILTGIASLDAAILAAAERLSGADPEARLPVEAVLHGVTTVPAPPAAPAVVRYKREDAGGATGGAAAAPEPPTRAAQPTGATVSLSRLRHFAPLTYKLGDLGQAVGLRDKHITEGDSRYVARELLNQDYRDLAAADVFSLGLTLYELASGRPLPTEGDEYQRLRDGILDTTKVPHLGEHTREVLAAMLHPEPNQRPAAAYLARLPLVLRAVATASAAVRPDGAAAALLHAMQAAAGEGSEVGVPSPQAPSATVMPATPAAAAPPEVPDTGSRPSPEL